MAVIHHLPARIAGLLLLLLTIPVCHAGGEPADEPVTAADDPARPGWTRLVYTGDALPGTPTTTFELVESSADSLDIPGVRFPDNSIAPMSTHRVYLLAVSGQGAASNTVLRIWFDAMTGAVLQRDRLKTGADGGRKTVRFGPDGAMRVRLKPANSVQAQATPATWTDRKDKVFPYDLTATGCRHVTVPALLPYTVSVADRDPGERSLCVFQDGALYRVWLHSGGSKKLAIDYAVSSAVGAHRISGTREIEQIRLRVESVSGDADPGKFELLELRGTIVIHVDPVAGLPVEISGSRGLYRDIRMHLSGVTLAD